MTYKANYVNTNQVPNTMTPTGKTSRECIEIEEQSQKAVAECKEWLIAKKLNPRGDSKPELESMGFTNIKEKDDLFFSVTPPENWTKETSGYWTTIYDSEGTEQITQFYKGAFYDRDAFINIT